MCENVKDDRGKGRKEIELGRRGEGGEGGGRTEETEMSLLMTVI